MKKLLFALAALAAGSVFAALHSSQPQAHEHEASRYYDDDHGRPDYRRPRRYEDDGYYRPRHYYKPRKKVSDGCRALIRGTGVGNILPGIARINAIRAWKREAQAVYGRGFSFTAAKGSSVNCNPVGLTVRCTAKGRPCV